MYDNVFIDATKGSNWSHEIPVLAKGSQRRSEAFCVFQGFAHIVSLLKCNIIIQYNTRLHAGCVCCYTTSTQTRLVCSVRCQITIFNIITPRQTTPRGKSVTHIMSFLLRPEPQKQLVSFE